MSELEKERPTQITAPALHLSTPQITRRRLLAGAGQIALLTAIPMACAPAASTPWADGTFWDDGLGWTT